MPIEELKKDLRDSLDDIAICTNAKEQGINVYSGGGVQQRLDDNRHFVKVITAEIERRKAINC